MFVGETFLSLQHARGVLGNVPNIVGTIVENIQKLV